MDPALCPWVSSTEQRMEAPRFYASSETADGNRAGRVPATISWKAERVILVPYLEGNAITMPWHYNAKCFLNFEKKSRKASRKGQPWNFRASEQRTRSQIKSCSSRHTRARIRIISPATNFRLKIWNTIFGERDLGRAEVGRWELLQLMC